MPETTFMDDVREAYGLTPGQMNEILDAALESDVSVKLRRMAILLEHLDPLVAREDLPRFMLTPNRAMGNFPPYDLLQSGFAFRKLIELVERNKQG